MTALSPALSELVHDPHRLPPAPVGRAFVPARPAAAVRPLPGVVPAQAPTDFSSSEWDTTPSVPNQLQIPDAFRPDKVEALTLRTNSAEDMKRYADILTNVRSNRACYAIVEHDRQFHDGVWLIFMVLQHFMFKRVLNLRKPSP